MDSITHVALGAIVGEAIAGKRLGKHALYLGAIGQSLPDIDFLAAFFLPATDNLLAHRGFTHSFMFGIMATVACAYFAGRLYRAREIPIPAWIIFWGAEIFLHLFLDACNAYGVGWFEPFDHTRVSFHMLFVADPFFSLPPGIALIALTSLSSKNTSRRFWIFFGLFFCGLYFIYALNNKTTIEKATVKALQAENIDYKRHFTTPTPLNTWLWYVVAETDSGFHTGYRSTFDREAKIEFTYFPQHAGLIKKTANPDDVQKLKRFSQGYYTLQNRNDTIVFNDLRFGQIAGWHDPEAKFVFHYYVSHPDANLMVIQRGRFSNWNKETFGRMVERIRGE